MLLLTSVLYMSYQQVKSMAQPFCESTPPVVAAAHRRVPAQSNFCNKAAFSTSAAALSAGQGAASAAVTASASPAMEVVRVPALSDNYIWLLHEPKSNLTAVVDPAEVEPVNRVLKER